jgi:hypothetical protein
MRTAVSLGITVGILALPTLAADKEGKQVRVTGTLQIGVVAIGGETTGIVIQAKKATYEVDLGNDKKLRRKADKLDGKKVVVTGKLTVRQGIEVPERRIIVVTSLEPAPDGR